MKNNLKTGFAAALFLIMAAAIFAKPSMLFNIRNETTFDLGTVTIYNTLGTPFTINIPGSGMFTININGGIAGVVMNGQVIPNNGQGTNIILPQGFIVQVKLTGNLIVVTDQQVIYSPPKPHGK